MRYAYAMEPIPLPQRCPDSRLGEEECATKRGDSASTAGTALFPGVIEHLPTASTGRSMKYRTLYRTVIGSGDVALDDERPTGL